VHNALDQALARKALIPRCGRKAPQLAAKKLRDRRHLPLGDGAECGLGAEDERSASKVGFKGKSLFPEI